MQLYPKQDKIANLKAGKPPGVIYKAWMVLMNMLQLSSM